MKLEGSTGSGMVVAALGNLMEVEFQGDICQGEMAMIHLGNLKLAAEVIEIAGNIAKIQVFEDTRGIKLGCPVTFLGNLLQAELAPGLLTSIFDGLQNPLEQVASVSGLFLSRGVYLPPLDRKRKWGFTPVAKIGDSLIRGDSLGWVPEERCKHQIMLPFSYLGTYKVVSIVSSGSYTIEEPLATVIDSNGKEHTLNMLQKWPIKFPLRQGEKIKPSKMMETGLRILDTQFPLLKGGTFASPGPFGAGKTVLQHHLSKYSSVDIVVIVACGERAGEVVEVLRTFPHLIDEKTNEPLIKRTVMICNTSSMPVSAREASVYMGITIAEYYRQMGIDILLLADSTSRWAQAMREMSGRLEEIPGEEAFPAYLASRISSFYERAGAVRLNNQMIGSLTIGGTVSPAGGNFEEPVTQATLSIVGAFLGLSKARSDARRYPAIDPLISWTKYLDQVGIELEKKLPGWTDKVKRISRILREGDEIGKRMEVVGEEGTAIEDMVTYLKSELYEICYLQQNAFDKEDSYCSLDRQIELFKLLHEIYNLSFHFDSHDEARAYFLTLQSEIKNLNYLPFRQDNYLLAKKAIEEKIKMI